MDMNIKVDTHNSTAESTQLTDSQHKIAQLTAHTSHTEEFKD